VFAVLEEDFAEQSSMWTPNRQTYSELGRAFAETPELRAHGQGVAVAMVQSGTSATVGAG